MEGRGQWKGQRKLGTAQPLLPAAFDDRHAAISPDGKWLAYDSVEAGPAEVYVRPLRPDGTVGNGKWRVSTGGGIRPIWFRNSRELLYHSSVTSRAMVVSYSARMAATSNPERRSNGPTPHSEPTPCITTTICRRMGSVWRWWASANL